MNTHNIYSSLCTVILLFIGVLIGMSGCYRQSTDEDPENVVDSFSEAYFNYDFSEAMKYTTPESQRWIRFAASNIYPADIEVLKSMETGASVQVTNIEDGETDSMLVATVQVDGYMTRDTLGQSGRVVDGQVFQLPLVKRNGKWLIHLQGQLRGRYEEE